MHKLFCICTLFLLAGIVARPACAQQSSGLLLKNMFLIDGNGGTPVKTNMLVQDGIIASVGEHIEAAGAKELNLNGRFVMPSLISAHVHIGNVKGTSVKASNYTRENILAQLQRYQRYGVGTILVLGTDQPMLFTSGLLDSSVQGLLYGARIHSAGYGFNVPPKPPPGGPMDHVFRPASAAAVPAQVDSLAALGVRVVKMWVDDFGGSTPKMQPDVYKAIIEEAHRRNMRVASHVYYLEDARKLVAAGVDIIAHSIRDSPVDDDLLQQMKLKSIAYIPTLSLDALAFMYAQQPEWMEHPFFKAALEPGVYDMITAGHYRDSLKTSPSYQKQVNAFEMALANLKRIYNAGILVALGTDSGATPLRVQGFSEHLELQLMVEAGLTPLQAITVATKNAAAVLQVDALYGTLEKGKVADFIVLNTDPSENIQNSRQIHAVYKAGVPVQ